MGRINRHFMLSRVLVRTISSTQTIPKLETGTTIRMASSDDLYNAVNLRDELKPKFIDAALSRGDICIGVFDQTRLVSFQWLSFSTAPHIHGLWVGFEKPYYYSYKAYTDKDYRGRHLRVPAVMLANKLALSKGYKYAILFIETHNYPSIEANKYTDAKTVGYAGYIKLFGNIYPFRSQATKKHHFSFYNHSD